MSNKQTRTPRPDPTAPGSAAQGRDGGGDPARRSAGDATPPGGQGGAQASAMAAEVELAMSDLLADANGEVVFFNDSDLRRLAIATDAAVVADGRAGPHRTAAGHAVNGFRFLTFDNGVTLYYQAGLDVVVRGAR